MVCDVLFSAIAGANEAQYVATAQLFLPFKKKSFLMVEF